MREKITRLTQLFGPILTIVAISFIGRSIWMQKMTILSNIDPAQIALITFGGGGIYIIGNFLLALAWNSLLNWQGKSQVNLKINIGIFGRTQILKYVPGNLFSLPSRHLLSHQYGIKHGVLIGAATFEFAGLLAASGFIAIIGILFTKNSNVLFAMPIAISVLVLIILSPFILRILNDRCGFCRKFSFFQGVGRVDYSELLVAWFLYLGFFMITGIMLLWTVLAITITWYDVPIIMFFSIYAISWFTGFVTPGAPAGAGVREGIMILFLSSYIGEPQSILVSILLRFATMVGDIAFYFISLRFRHEVLVKKNDEPG